MAEKKEFNRNFITSLKNAAREIAPAIKERSRLEREIAERQKRIADIDEDIAERETTIRRKTGYGVMDLVKREVLDTEKIDKNGKPVKITQYSLIYPETVVPPVETLRNEGDREVAPKEEDLPFMVEDVMNHSNEI